MSQTEIFNQLYHDGIITAFDFPLSNNRNNPHLHNFGPSTACIGAPRPSDEQIHEMAERLLDTVNHGAGIGDVLDAVSSVCSGHSTGIKALVLVKAGLVEDVKNDG